MGKIETEEMTKNVTNAFDVVTKIYEESGFLLKEFFSKLGEHKFVGKNNTYIENYAGRSKSLDYTEYWLVNDAELCFKNEGKTDYNQMISVTISFRSFNFNKQASDQYLQALYPHLLVGILENMGEDERRQLYKAYHNEDDNYEYASPKNEWQPDKLIEFNVRKNKDKKGWFYAIPLLQVKGTEDVECWTKKIVEDWKKKYGNTKSG